MNLVLYSAVLSCCQPVWTVMATDIEKEASTEKNDKLFRGPKVYQWSDGTCAYCNGQLYKNPSQDLQGNTIV